MLDVHPARHAATTWREFGVHIATIVLGLLIAVGLEQVVDKVHRDLELNETREALKQERIANRADWKKDERDWRTTFVELQNDLRVLEYVKAHPHMSGTDLPGDLRWLQHPFASEHAVWDAARQRGITQRMSLKEANGYAEYYGLLDAIGRQSLDTWNAINEARRFEFIQRDPTRLSPSDLEQAILLTSVALEKHVTFGDSFGRFAFEFPSEPHTITWDRIELWQRAAAGANADYPETAKRQTDARLAAANAGPQDDQIGPEAFR